MKGFLSGLGVAALCAWALTVVAEDRKAPQEPAGDGKKPYEASMDGEIIDLPGYCKDGSCGQDYWKQAKANVKGGSPACLRTFDGKIYVITPYGRDGFEPLKYVGEKVHVQGTVFERDGIKCLVAKELDKLPPYAGVKEGDGEGRHAGGEKRDGK